MWLWEACCRAGHERLSMQHSVPMKFCRKAGQLRHLIWMGCKKQRASTSSTHIRHMSSLRLCSVCVCASEYLHICLKICQEHGHVCSKKNLPNWDGEWQQRETKSKEKERVKFRVSSRFQCQEGPCNESCSGCSDRSVSWPVMRGSRTRVRRCDTNTETERLG